MLSDGAGLLDGFSRFDFSARQNILAAVSGGGDSLALLLIVQAHLSRTAPASRLVAATVDHALRPESAAEAARVADFCAARGIPHMVLRWHGEKPASGLSAAAREARYQLLAEAAQKRASDLVLTGHSADDQAETVLMRKARGSGSGLAGIAPATLFEGKTWFIRPLLGQGRQALRAFLRSEGVQWIDDPSNDNPAYERVRSRRELAASADPDARKRALLEEARQAAAARIALGEKAATVITAHARLAAPGLVGLDRDFLGEGEVALHALRLPLASVGGREYLPERELAAGLLADLQAWPEQKPFRAAASGAIVEARKAGIFLHREFRGEGPAAVAATDGAVWDGRFRIDLAGRTCAGLTIGPAGRWAEAGQAPADIPASLIRAALAAEPAVKDAPHPYPLPAKDGERGASALRPASLAPPAGRTSRQGDEGQSVDHRGICLTQLVAPYARYLPSFDLAPARALAELLGALSFPEPPFARHDRP